MQRHLYQLAKLLVYGAISLFLILSTEHNVIELFASAIVLYLLFFFVFFRKEMGTKPSEWFRPHEDGLPSVSPDKQQIYEASGLSESDIHFFREKMRVTKERIQQAEAIINEQGKLEGIATRYRTLPVMKDYFKELVKQPERLYEADKFLNTYLPSLLEVSERYQEINHHATKTQSTYEVLTETAHLFEELCQQIEAAYLMFQSQDFEDVELEGLHLKQQAASDEFEDF